MNERIRQLALEAFQPINDITSEGVADRRTFDQAWFQHYNEKFAELIVKECIDKIETHRIPVGNSAAGEMACEWTYEALKEVRDEIKEHFGVEE